MLPYDERLKLLPSYLQQLVMESLGKSVRNDGSRDAPAPCRSGGAGRAPTASTASSRPCTRARTVVPADLIGVIAPETPYADNHRALLANLFAQAEALAQLAQASDDPHRAYPGNRPSTLILLDALTPHSLGMLLALYEHSVYLQGVLWGINPFDQFGVELGKQVATRLLPALAGDVEAADPVTRARAGRGTQVGPRDARRRGSVRGRTRPAWRASAHSACSLTTGCLPTRARHRSAASTSGVAGALPSATAILRSQRS